MNTTSQKRTKLKSAQRRAVIVALQAAGKTQTQIAKDLGVSRKTIVRDIADLKPAQEAVASILERAQRKIQELMPVEDRIQNYVQLLDVAKKTKQPSAGSQILQRLDEIDGMTTDKDRMKAKQGDPAQAQPMFVLPPGARIAVAIDTRTPSPDTPAISEATAALDTRDCQSSVASLDTKGDG